MSPIPRFIVVVGVAVSLLGGVTFAALQSPVASLTGNSIESATADLRIGTTNTSFSTTRVGYDFPGVVPGGEPVPSSGNIFYLKNFGTTTLSIKVAIATAPTNLNNVDLNKVFLNFTRVDSGYTVSLSVKSIVDSHSTGGVTLGDTITGSTVAQYSLKASMSADAFNGSSATISGIDLQFSGIGL